mmetsp:Transcript_22512/g.34809  ORF Transcript_22512/g.34809 Transcript_22512/m.34809 type:complete len:93 (-) Transcript_22512:23-301(-)
MAEENDFSIRPDQRAWIFAGYCAGLVGLKAITFWMLIAGIYQWVLDMNNTDIAGINTFNGIMYITEWGQLIVEIFDSVLDIILMYYLFLFIQ